MDVIDNIESSRLQDYFVHRIMQQPAGTATAGAGSSAWRNLNTGALITTRQQTRRTNVVNAYMPLQSRKRPYVFTNKQSCLITPSTPEYGHSQQAPNGSMVRVSARLTFKELENAVRSGHNSQTQIELPPLWIELKQSNIVPTIYI